MAKKIITLILVFILCMPAISFAYETQKSDLSYPDVEEINNLIYSLTEKTLQSGEVQVSRGEFVTLLVNLITRTAPFGMDSDYTDIEKGTELSYCAYYANKAGIVSDSEKFNPDGFVSATEAIKMVVSALGYNELAKVYGGYPVGYLKVASDIGLDDGINLRGDIFSANDVSILLYNMLCTQMYDISAIAGGDAKYIKTGRTILDAVYGISYIDGIVTANKYTSLTSSEGGTGSDSVVIGNYSIQTDSTTDYLGKNVRAFVTEVLGSYKAVAFVSAGNCVVTFNTNDYPEFKDGSVYLGCDKQKRFDLSRVPVYIVNGKNADVNNLNEIFKNEEITASIIDNDSNGNYDVVVLNIWNYCLVKTANVYGGIVADEFSKENNIDFSDVNCECEISGENITDIYDISGGMLLAFCVSEDNMLITIEVQSDISKHTVDGINVSEKIISVEDSSYRYGRYFENNFIRNLHNGENVSLMFGINGEVVAMGEMPDISSYGYIIAVDNGNGFSPARIKLINQNSKIQIYEIPDKLTADGNKITSSEFVNKIKESERLVRYKASADGILKNVDFADKEVSGFLTGAEDTDNSLTFCKEGTYTYKSTSGTLGDKFNISSAKVFIVPNDDENTTDSDYSAGTSAVFKNDQRITLSVYDVDTKLNAGVVVWESGLAHTVSSSDRSMVVCSVNPAIDPEGESAYCINVFSNGKYDRYYSNEKSEKTIKNLMPGDIVRFTVSDNGFYVEDIVHEYSCTSDKLYSAYGSGGIIDYVKGYVYDTSKSQISVVNQERKSTVAPSMDNLFTASYSGDCIFVHVTTGETGTIEKARVVTYPGQEVQGWISVGDKAPYVVIDRNYYTTKNIFVYVFES